ncbi:MAG: superoxide dismutase [Planctomycetota bacterium]
MAFELPKLPFPGDALAPHISAETLEYHHGKHHNAYVTKLNDAIAGTADAEKSLEEIVKSASGGLFNNAAQHYNHSFYWHCLSPKGGGKPEGSLAAAIEKQFGTFEQFHEEFTNKSATLFGSGWTWLVKTPEGLQITQEGNAGCPITSGQTPLLTCDVWEHAYYVDYRNARPKYLDAFWKLVNWEFAQKNFDNA